MNKITAKNNEKKQQKREILKYKLTTQSLNVSQNRLETLFESIWIGERCGLSMISQHLAF